MPKLVYDRVHNISWGFKYLYILSLFQVFVYSQLLTFGNSFNFASYSLKVISSNLDVSNALFALVTAPPILITLIKKQLLEVGEESKG